MRISSRFTEYGITGALLLISQGVVFFFIFGKTNSQFFQQVIINLKSISEGLPSAFHPALMSVAAALSIVSIFFLGLCLDLLGTYFILWEMNQFKTHLEKNKGWINSFIDLNKSYINDDYGKLMSEFGSMLSKTEWKSAFSIFLLWNKRYQRGFAEGIKKSINRFKLISFYNRFHSFLISFVMVRSGSVNLELFFDEVHLWRTSRSISTILFIVAIELYFLKYFNHEGDLIFLVIFSLLFILSTFISLRSHGRMCSTLLSVVYTIAHKKTDD